MNPEFLWDRQGALFGDPKVIGFGTDAFFVRVIERDKANAVIAKNHYSRKFYAASTIHLGVFSPQMVGVLQFGYAMNPVSMASVVAETEIDQYLELNRMWLDDTAPRNTESRALSYAIRFIRRGFPRVRWIQSFADERCGLFGVVYQAANFRFFGEHVSRFWEIDGEFFHNSLMTRDPGLTPAAALCQQNKHRAVAHDLRQFRYLYFMRPRFARGVLLTEKPFPKNNAASLLDERAPMRVSQEHTLVAAPNTDGATA